MGCSASVAQKQPKLSLDTASKVEELFDRMKGDKAIADADKVKNAQADVDRIKAELAELQKKKRSSSAALSGEDGAQEADMKGKLTEAQKALEEAQEAGLTRKEAQDFFKGKFGKLSADAMFNEVDVNNDGSITKEEFVSFWAQVKKSGYKEEEIMEEINEMLSGEEGATWVDWKDDRNVASNPTAPAGKPSKA